MSVSTVPAAKAALLAALLARIGLDSALVRWGIPSRVVTDQVRVYVGRARNVNREWAGLGAKRLEETYTIDVHVEAYTTGDDAQQAEEAMWAAVAEIDAAVRGDITLAGTVMQSKPTIGDQELGPATSEGGTLLSRTTVSVDCLVRI